MTDIPWSHYMTFRVIGSCVVHIMQLSVIWSHKGSSGMAECCTWSPMFCIKNPGETNTIHGVVHVIYILYYGRVHRTYHKGCAPAIVQLLFNVSRVREDRKTFLDSVQHSCSFALVLSLLLGLLLLPLLRVTSSSSSNPHVCSQWLSLFLHHCIPS